MDAERAVAATIAFIRITAWTAVTHVVVSLLLQGHLILDLGLLAFAILPGLRERRRTALNWALVFSIATAVVGMALASGIAGDLIDPDRVQVTVDGFTKVTATSKWVTVAFASFVAITGTVQAWFLSRRDVRNLFRREPSATAELHSQ
jgi:hypothetical protein